MLRLRLNIANRLIIVAHMQQAGEGCHPVELFMAHDAQIINVAFTWLSWALRELISSRSRKVITQPGAHSPA